MSYDDTAALHDFGQRNGSKQVKEEKKVKNKDQRKIKKITKCGVSYPNF